MQYLFTPLKLSVFLSFLFFTACNSKKETAQAVESDQEIFSEDLPPDFLIFYKKFHTDSVFQLNHVLFPLEGQQAISEEGQEVDTNFKWQKQDWNIMHTPDMMNGSFVTEFMNLNGIITENITDQNKIFSMVRRFTKLGDEWMLIYYKEMGK